MKPKLPFLKSVKAAVSGILGFFRHERNGKIELVIAAGVLILSYVVEISRMEWLVVLWCVAMVITSEMLNSAVEQICDLVQKEFHPVVKKIKDVSAGAVLFSAVISVVIGCIIFIPRIWMYLFP